MLLKQLWPRRPLEVQEDRGGPGFFPGSWASAMVVRWLMVAALVVHGRGWWNASTPPKPSPAKPWWRGKVEEWVPAATPWLDGASETFSKVASLTEPTAESGFDWSLWTLADLAFSLLGWTLFRSAWAGVRNGCRRISVLHPPGMLHHRPLHLGGLLAGGVIGVCGDDDGGVVSSTSPSCAWRGCFCGPTVLGWNA